MEVMVINRTSRRNDIATRHSTTILLVSSLKHPCKKGGRHPDERIPEPDHLPDSLIP